MRRSIVLLLAMILTGCYPVSSVSLSMPLLFIFSAKTEFEGRIAAPDRIALVVKNSFLSIIQIFI